MIDRKPINGVNYQLCTLLALVLLHAVPPSAAAAAESREISEQELDEVLVDGRRPLRNSRAVVAWLARLVGEFTVDGAVDLHYLGESKLLDVSGRSSCSGFGSEPAVMCTLNIRWPEVPDSNQDSIARVIANLDPAIIMFGFEPTRVGIHHMLVGNDGIAEGSLGYLLSEDTLVARGKCGSVGGACERVVRITAEPAAQMVRMEIELETDLRKAVTIMFAMRRVQGSPSAEYPETGQ